MPMDLPPLGAAYAPSERKRRYRNFTRKALRLLLAVAYLLGLAIVVKLVGKVLNMP
jgi:hypothetical protein